MNVTSEIKNKEKTLAELMVKILKEPLKPLDSSLKKLHEEVLDTKDKVEEITDAINAVGTNTEEIINPLKRSLRELQDDDIPGTISKLREFISTQVEEKKQDMSAALSQQSAHYDSQLKAATGEVFGKLSEVLGQQSDAIQRYQQAVIDGAEALSQQLLAVNQSLEDASVDNACEQRSTRERDQRLAERLESDRREVLSGLETLSTDVQAALAQHLIPPTQAIESLQTSLQALTEAVSEQKSHLEAQIAASQGRFRYVVIIFALFATSTLAYIGYDIWKNLAP
ncbi:hypothetical protein Q7I36_20270 [Aeromonas veronii]|uniref:hypothetical protein n=1 Tax=Aeromonas veronii TaxID=654 RepID=UPI003003E3EC